MNVRAYARWASIHYHDYEAFLVALTLAKACDWLQIYAGLESSTRLNSPAYVRAYIRAQKCTLAYARVYARTKYESSLIRDNQTGHFSRAPIRSLIAETDWATEHVVQRFRKKYFLRRKIFLAEKNIFLAEKNISCGKKYFLRKNIFLAEKNSFLADKYIFCGKKYITCGEKYFLRRKIYFLRRKIYFLRKKYISCGEKYISCGEKYFLRKNIFCTMLPISFRT